MRKDIIHHLRVTHITIALICFIALVAFVIPKKEGAAVEELSELQSLTERLSQFSVASVFSNNEWLGVRNEGIADTALLSFSGKNAGILALVKIEHAIKVKDSTTASAIVRQILDTENDLGKSIRAAKSLFEIESVGDLISFWNATESTVVLSYVDNPPLDSGMLLASSTFIEADKKKNPSSSDSMTGFTSWSIEKFSYSNTIPSILLKLERPVDTCRFQNITPNEAMTALEKSRLPDGFFTTEVGKNYGDKFYTWKLTDSNSLLVGRLERKVVKLIPDLFMPYAKFDFAPEGREFELTESDIIATQEGDWLANEFLFFAKMNMKDLSFNLRQACEIQFGINFPKGSFATTFPNLNQAISGYPELSYTKLEDFLVTRSEVKFASVNVFGTNIPIASLSFWICVLIAVLQYYLFVHLRYLDTQNSSQRLNSEEVQSWFALYDEKFAKYGSLTSLTIIPLIIVITATTQHIFHAQFAFGLEFFILLVCAFSSTYFAINIAKILKKIRK